MKNEEIKNQGMLERSGSPGRRRSHRKEMLEQSGSPVRRRSLREEMLERSGSPGRRRSHRKEMKKLKIKKLKIKECWSGAEVLGDGGVTGKK